MVTSTVARLSREYVFQPFYRAYGQLRQYRLSREQSEQPRWNPDQWLQLHPTLKSGYKLCIIPVAVIFLVNLIVTIWVAATRPISNGLTATLYIGKCETTQWANFGIHILINTLAAVLFAASSYMMQRLTAPTRSEIDRNHQGDRSIKIGSLALSNLMLLGGSRSIAFILLWSSSLPIHLMFNSLVVRTSTNAEWSKIGILIDRDVVPDDSPTDANRDIVLTYTGFPSNIPNDNEGLVNYIVAQKPPLTRLDAMECVETYATGQSAEWGDVLLVSSNLGLYEDYSGDNASNAYDPSYRSGFDDWRTSTCLAGNGYGGLPWSWMCGTFAERCDPGAIRESGTWVLNNKPVDHCLARRLPPACELNMNLAIMIAVQICIVGKLVAMGLTVLISRDEPLVTVGDAVVSFLRDPDETTDGHCIAGPGHFKNIFSIDTHAGVHGRISRQRTVFFEMTGAYVMAASHVRHLPLLKTATPPANDDISGVSLSVSFFAFFAWVYTQTATAYNLEATPFTFAAMWQLGLSELPLRWTGSIAKHLMSYSGCSSASTSYIRGAVAANSPQLALSVFYLSTNNFFTRFSTAQEMRSYHLQRRGLRVSSPTKGSAQRGTYFLQFPLRYSIPLLAHFTILHTFLSQTLFLRRTYAIWPTSFTDPDSLGRHLISLIGFSPLAAFIFAVLVTLLVAVILSFGLIRHDWILPSTNGDSRAISALCHPPKFGNGHEDNNDDAQRSAGSITDTVAEKAAKPSISNLQTEVHLSKVRWGVTSMDMDGVGHCAFSLQPVRPPEIGEVFGKSNAKNDLPLHVVNSTGNVVMVGDGLS